MYRESDLVRIAKRENNKKRSYVVVNRLQGKHIPVRPDEALSMFGALAEALDGIYDAHRLLVVGFAETATAIGAAAAVRLGAYYMQTTRESIAGVKYLYFSEEHSHATEQKLVKDDLDQLISRIDRIVFAEDEVTTGKTILNMIRVLEQEYPGQVSYAVASILNGMDEEALHLYKKKGIDLHYLVKTDHTAYAEAVRQYTKRGTYISCMTDQDTFQYLGTQNAEMQSMDDENKNRQNQGIRNAEMQSINDQNMETQNQGIRNAEMQRMNDQHMGTQNQGIRNAEMQRMNDQHMNKQKQKIQNVEIQRMNDQNMEIQNLQSENMPKNDSMQIKLAGSAPVRQYAVGGYMDARRLVEARAYEQACMRLWQDIDRLLHGVIKGRVLVLGTEEFMYPALFSAAQIAHNGCEVRFHATTRSPIEVYEESGYPLHVRYALCSMYDKNRRTFVYDIGAYDTVLIITDAHNEQREGVDSLVRAVLHKNQNISIIRWC